MNAQAETMKQSVTELQPVAGISEHNRPRAQPQEGTNGGKFYTACVKNLAAPKPSPGAANTFPFPAGIVPVHAAATRQNTAHSDESAPNRGDPALLSC